MLCDEGLHGSRLPVQRHPDGGERLAVLDGKSRQGYACLADRRLDILRVPISARFGTSGAQLRPQYVQTGTNEPQLSRAGQAQKSLTCWLKAAKVSEQTQGIELSAEENPGAVPEAENADLQVADETFDPRAVADRLAEALLGLDRSAVLDAPGVSKSTLSRALRAGRVKRQTLVALAHATGVERSWLIDGVGPKRELQPGDTTADGHLVVQGPTMAIERSAPPELDPDRLASALAAADAAFAAERRAPTPRQRVQAMLLIYNHLSQIDVEPVEPDAERG